MWKYILISIILIFTNAFFSVVASYKSQEVVEADEVVIAPWRIVGTGWSSISFEVSHLDECGTLSVEAGYDDQSGKIIRFNITRNDRILSVPDEILAQIPGKPLLNTLQISCLTSLNAQGVSHNILGLMLSKNFMVEDASLDVDQRYELVFMFSNVGFESLTITHGDSIEGIMIK